MLVSGVWLRSLDETMQVMAVLCTLQGKNLNTLPAAALLSIQVYSSFLNCIGLMFYFKAYEPRLILHSPWVFSHLLQQDGEMHFAFFNCALSGWKTVRYSVILSCFRKH